MAMKKQEKLLLEALGGLLSQRAELGLSSHDDEESSHYSQARWETINSAFKLKISDLIHYDSVSSAFKQTHDYKYIDSPTFKVAFESELKSRAVPTNEVERALSALDSIVESMGNETEKDAGWNPNMKDIVDVTTNADNRTPKTENPFTGGGVLPENTHKGRANKFKVLKESNDPWNKVLPQLNDLHLQAEKDGMYTLADTIKLYVEKRNKKISKI